MRERDRQSIVGTPSGRMDQETVVRPELKENFKSEGLRDKNASTCDVSLQCDIQTGHLENNVYLHEKQIQELENKINSLQQEKYQLEDDLMRERDRKSILGKPSGRMDQETVVRPE